jgi:hypothetical protein
MIGFREQCEQRELSNTVYIGIPGLRAPFQSFSDAGIENRPELIGRISEKHGIRRWILEGHYAVILAFRCLPALASRKTVQANQEWV